MFSFLNTYYLLRKLVPGLLPLVILIILEGTFGIEVAMTLSLTYGFLSLTYFYHQQDKVDILISLNLILIVLFGGAGLLLDTNAYKLFRPALLETALSIILGVVAYTRYNMLMLMSKKYVKGIVLTEGQLKIFNSAIKNVLFILIFHIAAILVSAIWFDYTVWFFVARIFVFVLFLGYFGYEASKIFYYKKESKHEEWLPIVDESGGVKGKVARSCCHNGERILHPVVHLHILRGNSIFLQKRPMNKTVQPGKWDTAVGGHLSFGENLDDGLRRETFEEIGITDFTPRFILKYVWETDVESELVYTFVANYEKDIKVNHNEVDDGKFWPVQQIKENIGKSVFTPNFEKEFEFLYQVYFNNK